MTAINEFHVKSPSEARDDILRVIKNGLIRRGVASPNVGPSTDWYLVATSLGNELAVVGANAIVKCDEQMPDTAIEVALARIAALFKLEKQAAAGSIGSILIICSATSPVATDTELTDKLGQRFKVTVGGNYANGAQVPIEAISVGFATNHAAGDVLNWADAPPYCDDKVTVSAAGLVNGIDEETDETLRTRLLSLLQTPAGSGNWEHCVELAEKADSRVGKCVAYPAVQGPSTIDLAVMAAPTTTSKSRLVAPSVVSGIVAPFVKGKLPEHANVSITGVVDVNADVAFGLSLPEAPTANPPGPGGGWLNGTPWPAPDGVSTFRCKVTVATSATTFTVDATTAPTPSVTRIAWLSPTDWKLRTALVIAVSGTSGAYAITIDTPFSGIFVGCYIWPEPQEAQAYVDAVLSAFALMGPGEKTTNVSALVRGFRHPTPANSWPYALGPTLLRAVTDGHEEVLATQYLHRFDGTTTNTGASGQVIPQVPAALTTAPNVYVPRHIAFYRIP